MRRLFALAVLVLYCACSGGGAPAGPGGGTGTVASVAVSSSAGTSIFIGATLNLSATAMNSTGGVITGKTATWSSSNSVIATVSSTGVVTAIAAGIATISAKVDTIVGSTAVIVSATSAQLSCTSVTPLAMNVGDVRVLSGIERSNLCLGGGAGSEYVLIPLNTSLDTTTASTQFTLTSTNTVAVANAPSPLILAHGGTGAAHGFSRDLEFERELHDLERRELTPKMHAARGGSVSPSRMFSPGGISRITGVPASPTVGQIISLNGSLSSCTSPAMHGATIVAISSRAIIAVDTLAPPNGFTTADYQNFAITFDTLVFPIDTLNFGVPSDIDANGRAVLFFSPLVNQISVRGSGSYVGGFFYKRDLFPPTVPTAKLDACAGSNNGEMFYLPVVDAAQQYNEFFANKAVATSQMITTFVHEFQHLINASHHISNANQQSFEESWLDEGMAIAAQELLYFRVAGFGPRQRLTAANITTGGNANGTESDIFQAYGIQGMQNLQVYLQTTQTRTPYDNVQNVASNGAAWQFLRYVLDNTTGAQPAFTRALVNGSSIGYQNLTDTFSGAIPAWSQIYQQWVVAQYLDGTGITSNPAYAFQSWNFRDVMAHAVTSLGVFPLVTRTLLPTTTVSMTLRGGATGYIRFRVNSGLTAQIAPALTLSGSVSMALVRTF